MVSTDQLKKVLSKNKIIIGSNKIEKNLKTGKIKTLYVASNCPENKITDFEHYCKITKTEIVRLDIPNSELRIICKKPFFVSAIGVLK